MRLVGIQHDKVDRLTWKIVGRMLEPAIARSNGQFTLESVYDAIKNRDMQLWVTVDDKRRQILTAMVTAIRVLPTDKVAHLMFVGGTEMKHSYQFLPGVCEWAKANGCTAVQSHVRKGFRKMLKPHGFNFVARTEFGDLIHKDLT